MSLRSGTVHVTAVRDRTCYSGPSGDPGGPGSPRASGPGPQVPAFPHRTDRKTVIMDEPKALKQDTARESIATKKHRRKHPVLLDTSKLSPSLVPTYFKSLMLGVRNINPGFILTSVDDESERKERKVDRPSKQVLPQGRERLQQSAACCCFRRDASIARLQPWTLPRGQ